MRHRSRCSRISARGRAAIADEGDRLSHIGIKVNRRTKDQVSGSVLIDELVFLMVAAGQTTSNADLISLLNGLTIIVLGCALGLGLARDDSGYNQQDCQKK